MSTTSTTPTPEPAGGLSQVQRIINVFVSPSSTFSDLKRNPTWWVAWLLICVMSVPLIVAIQQKVGYDQLVRNQISTNARAREAMEKLPADQREQRIQAQAAFGKYIAYATPIIALIVYVIVAGVLMGTFNFGVGTEVSFSLALAITVFAYLPAAIKSILAAIALYAGADPEAFDPNNPVATNLGFFVARTDHPALYTLLSWVDLFGIWIVILLGIGFSSVSKVKRSTAIYIVAGWYVLTALLLTGLAAAFS